MAGLTDTNPNAGGSAPMLFADIIGDREQLHRGLKTPRGIGNIAIAAIDTPVSSLLSVRGLVGLGTTESLAPESWTAYHRQKSTSDAITAIPSLFLGIGVATKTAQGAGLMGRALEAASTGTGLRSTVARAAFSRAREVDEIERLVASTVSLQQTGPAMLFGQTVDAMQDAQRVGGELAQFGSTLGAVRGRVRNTRLVNGLKEGIAQEVAVLATMNQNEFLFPEGQGLGAAAALAVPFVGLNMGIEHVIGRAAMRKAFANAGRAGAEAASAAQISQQLLTPGQTAGLVVGEQNMMLAAHDFTLKRVAELEGQIPALVAAGNDLVPAEVYEQGFRELRDAADYGRRKAIESMGMQRLTTPALRDNGIESSIKFSGGEQEQLAQRLHNNLHVVGGAASLVDTGATVRYSEAMDRIAAQKRAADTAMEKAGNDAASAQAADNMWRQADEAEQQLAEYRVGIIETNGTTNGNVARLVPRAEQNISQAVRPFSAQGTVVFEQAVAGQRNVAFNVQTGQLELTEGRAIRQAMDEKSLSPEELNAVNMLVGKGLVSGDARFVNDFWQQFLAKPGAAKWDELPFAVLDAIGSGALKIPDVLKTSTEAHKVDSMVAGGGLANISLARKAEWLRAHVAQLERDPKSALHADLGWFAQDMEKTLNLRLTDKHGNPNALMHGLLTIARDLAVNPRAILVTQHANDGLDALFSLGLGRAGQTLPAQRALAEDQFFKSIREHSAMNDYDKLQGVGVIHRNMDVPTDTEVQMAQIARNKSILRAEMLVNSQSTLVADMSNMLRQHPSWQGANDVAALNNRSISENAVVTQQTFQARNNYTIQHGHSLGQAAERQYQAFIDANVTPILRRIREMRKDPARFAPVAAEVSNTHQLVSRGFALTSDDYVSGVNAIDISRPGAQALLNNLERIHGAPLKGAPEDPDDWLLFDVVAARTHNEYRPVQLSNEGSSLLREYGAVDKEAWSAMNSLRVAQGLPGMPRLMGHLPTLDARRFEWRYIADDVTGKVVGYVRGKTAKEADDLLAQSIGELSAGGNRVSARSQAQIAEYHDVHDGVFVSQLSDMTGIKQTGTAAGRNTDFRLDVSGDLLEEMTISMRNTFQDLKNRTVMANMAEAVSEVRTMQAGVHRAPGQFKERGQQKQFDARELWQNMLLATDKLPEDSLAKMGHDFVQTAANRAVGGIGEPLDQGYRAVAKLLGRATGEFGGDLTKAEEKLGQALLDGYRPFGMLSNPEIAAAVKFKPSVDPFKAERVLQQLNRATTAMFLKYANIAHPVLNFASIAVTAPAVVRQFQPMKGEMKRDWEARVGPWTDILDFDKGIATISAPKIVIEGFQMMMRRGANADFAYATKHGMLEANMLEELNTLNSIQPSGFDQVGEAIMKFDPINYPINKAMDMMGKARSSDTLSERSELWTRGWAHMMGLAIARRGGKDVTDAQAHEFAHYFSNQNIADFAPNIRGSVFRGVAGIPLGLFQSFGINFLQRVFKYVEDKNSSALIRQAFMQTAVFGANGLPGFPALNALMHGDEVDMEDSSYVQRLYNNLGKGPADILLNGTLSNIPQMLGAESGINFHTSGDVNPRLPTVPPAFSFLKQLAQGGSEMIQRTTQEIGNALDPAVSSDFGRVAESFANYAPSRGMRSYTELMLGEKVDRRGNLVVENTWEPASLFARLMTTRTSNELQVSAGIWQNSQAARQRQEGMSRVRQQMLSQMRNGELSEEELEGWMGRYIGEGGRADQWDRWLNYTTDMAHDTRGTRTLAKLVNKRGEVYEHNFGSLTRMLNAGVNPEFLEGEAQ